MGSESRGAINAEQFYVSVSRGRESAKVYSDMTQEELAHKIGYEHHTALVMIERGYSYPVWEKAERLAAVFGITLQELLAVKDDHRPWLTPPMLKTLWDLRYRENGRFLADLEELVAFMRELPQPAS